MFFASTVGISKFFKQQFFSSLQNNISLTGRQILLKMTHLIIHIKVCTIEAGT